jgi:hypothetical protein
LGIADLIVFGPKTFPQAGHLAVGAARGCGCGSFIGCALAMTQCFDLLVGCPQLVLGLLVQGNHLQAARHTPYSVNDNPWAVSYCDGCFGSKAPTFAYNVSADFAECFSTHPYYDHVHPVQYISA